MKALPFVLMLAVLVMPCSLFAQQEKPQAPEAPAGTKAQTAHGHKMSADHMKKHEEMMSRMKEMNARLDEKVAAMDAAKGDQKVEAMAAVIKEMVAQRKDMQEHMMKMHEARKGAGGHMKCSPEGKAGKGKGM
jgi:hypothetical protein